MVSGQKVSGQKQLFKGAVFIWIVSGMVTLWVIGWLLQ